MSITSATVINVAPELAGEDPSRIDYFIEEASQYINRRIWKGKSDYAHALFTAHLMLSGGLASTSGGAAGGGVVTSEKVGDLSISYGVSSVTPGTSYATTKYGAIFEELLRTLNVSPIVVN